MEKKIRVLQVTSGFRSGVSGGIASVLHNYCTASALKNSEIQFDYLSLGYQTFEPYREEIEACGGNLYCLDIHSTGKRRLIDIFFRMREFLKDKPFDIVHAKSGALTQLLMMCIAAKTSGINTVIAHSHNALIKSKGTQMIYNCLKPLFYIAADEYYACALMAAESMFPKGIIKRDKWVFIPNAINIEKFLYNEEIRIAYRQQLQLADKFVIGHVGRFNEQKNHAFLIDVFSEVSKQREEAVLMLVGNGDLQQSIRDKVDELGLSDKVIFMGQRNDVNSLMQAMDCFAFPSFYEGLGMVLIEAQAAGLPVVSSDRVPVNETRVTECIKYVPLSKDKWIESLKDTGRRSDRFENISSFAEAGYEIDSAAEKLGRFYREYSNSCK